MWILAVHHRSILQVTAGSWQGTKTWNYGRKLFASSRYPDILGYFGDVLFPSQVLGQVVDLIDTNLLLNEKDEPRTRFEKISNLVAKSFGEYPQSELAYQTFTIAYCTRENEGMNSVFHLALLSWNKATGWNEEWPDIPQQSSIIRSFGTGEKSIAKWYAYWNKTTEARTSRVAFSALCDAIQSNEDGFTGGAPQLVGIYRKGVGEALGVIYKNERFIWGLPVEESEQLNSVEWRNSIFERCDWRTKEPLQGAQRHKRPKGLGNAL